MHNIRKDASSKGSKAQMSSVGTSVLQCTWQRAYNLVSHVMRNVIDSVLLISKKNNKLITY